MILESTRLWNSDFICQTTNYYWKFPFIQLAYKNSTRTKRQKHSLPILVSSIFRMDRRDCQSPSFKYSSIKSWPHHRPLKIFLALKTMSFGLWIRWRKRPNGNGDQILSWMESKNPKPSFRKQQRRQQHKQLSPLIIRNKISYKVISSRKRHLWKLWLHKKNKPCKTNWKLWMR